MITAEEMRSARHEVMPVRSAGKESGAGVFMCRSCFVEKPEGHFYMRGDTGKRRSECVDCLKARSNANYHKNPRQHAVTTAQRLERNPKNRLWRSARDTARRKGLEFDIEESDILIPETCPYLGVKLTNTRLAGFVATNMSIDRIDSRKGYVKGNIQVMSRLANIMKSNATPEQLRTFAESILRGAK
jgi:hypothetical protein